MSKVNVNSNAYQGDARGSGYSELASPSSPHNAKKETNKGVRGGRARKG